MFAASHVPIVILGVIAATLLIGGVLALILTRRTHLRSWKMGVFFESEERFLNEKLNEKNGRDSEE